MGRLEQQCHFHVGFCGDVGLVLGKCFWLLLGACKSWDFRLKGHYRGQV